MGKKGRKQEPKPKAPKPQRVSNPSPGEEPQSGYYYDDSHGYEDYVPDPDETAKDDEPSENT